MQVRHNCECIFDGCVQYVGQVVMQSGKDNSSGTTSIVGYRKPVRLFSFVPVSLLI